MTLPHTQAPTAAIHVTVRYFAALREALGGVEQVALPPTVSTVGALRAWLVSRGGAHAQWLDGGRTVRVAVDQVLGDDAAPLANGVEVAFFPPVTGG